MPSMLKVPDSMPAQEEVCIVGQVFFRTKTKQYEEFNYR